MKRILKSTISLAIVLTLILSTNTLAYATEAPTAELYDVTSSADDASMGNTITPFSNQYKSGINISTSWKTIATSTTGFGCNVYIKCMNTTLDGLTVVPSDIRMLGKNGNVLWSENGAIPGQGSRIFVCGKDVYTIQIRTQAGVGVAYSHETTEAPN